MALSGSNLVTALIVGAVSFVVDQASKFYATDVMGITLHEMRSIIDGFVNFTHTKNYGINFGWFQMPPGDPRPQYILIGFSILVSFALLTWAARRWKDRGFAVAVGLIIGGAIGNAYDRFTLGAVTDFLNVTCCGKINPFAFNIADVTIFAGVALLLLQTRGDDARAEQEKTGSL